jgi:uncharacterized iron-regulated membrane protein
VHRLLAQATVGVCIGTCIGVALCFTAALLWPEQAVSHVFWPTFIASVGWALIRHPARAAVELLWIAAIATLGVPLSNAILTGDHFIVAALNGRWAVAGFDIGAIALAAGYVALARATLRRARGGRRNRYGRCVAHRPIPNRQKNPRRSNASSASGRVLARQRS